MEVVTVAPQQGATTDPPNLSIWEWAPVEQPVHDPVVAVPSNKMLLVRLYIPPFVTAGFETCPYITVPI